MLFTIGPEPAVAEGRYAGYTDETKLNLPFNDEWLVYQGGRTSLRQRLFRLTTTCASPWILST